MSLETGAVIGLAAGGAVLGLLLICTLCCCRGLCCRSSRERLSPFSASMASGSSFPAECEMVAPIINAALYFDQPPDLEKLRALVKQELVDRYTAFRATPVYECCQDMVWREVEVDLEKHVVVHSEVKSMAGLQARALALSVAPMKADADESLPLWEFHLVSNVGEGPSLLLARVSHCMGDGIALVQCFNAMVRDASGAKLAPMVYSKPERKHRTGGCSAACAVLSAIKDVASLPMSRYDDDTPFSSHDKRPLKYSGQRIVLRVPPVPLDQVKRIKNGAGATVNDVVFAATAGAIRSYCESIDGVALSKEVVMRALVPVAFPRSAGAPLDNKWTFVSVPLPVGEATPSDRLAASMASWQHIKSTPTAPVGLALTNFTAAHAPTAVGKQTAADLFARHSLVFSNVPGPSESVTLAGREMVGIDMIFPNLIHQFGAISYAGMIYMAFTIDDKQLPQHERLAEFLFEELAALEKEYVSVDSTSANDVVVSMAHLMPSDEQTSDEDKEKTHKSRRSSAERLLAKDTRSDIAPAPSSKYGSLVQSDSFADSKSTPKKKSWFSRRS